MSWSDPQRLRRAVLIVESAYPPSAQRDAVVSALTKLFAPAPAAPTVERGPFEDHSPPVHEVDSRFGGARR